MKSADLFIRPRAALVREHRGPRLAHQARPLLDEVLATDQDGLLLVQHPLLDGQR
jgi:hypothetical protein